MNTVANNIKLKNKLTPEEYNLLVSQIVLLINSISKRQVCKKLNISKEQINTIIKDEHIAIIENDNITRSKKAALSFEEREKAFAEALNSKDNSKVYYSGFTNIDSKCFIKCLECGTIYEIHCQVLRHKNTKKIYCAECERIRIEENQKKKQTKEQREKGIRKLISKSKKLKGRQLEINICNNCGSLFVGNNKYCSSRCSSRFHEHNHSRERIHRAKHNGYIDNDITLDKLINRDNNTCYICNKQCNINDYYIREDGTFIAGNNYPSIDHVIPLAKGGTHTWDNIRLACRICNSFKSDKLL